MDVGGDYAAETPTDEEHMTEVGALEKGQDLSENVVRGTDQC